jgi:multidrug efflux pump subunit AcrB
MPKQRFTRGGLAAWSIYHPIGVVMMALTVVVLGLFSLQTLGLDLLPHIIYPEIRVSINDPGVPATIMEDQVTRQIEEQLAITEDAISVQSQTSEGRSSLSLSFAYGKDIDIALRDASTRLDRAKRFLPDTIQPPTIYKLDPSQIPALILAVSSSLRDPVELRTWVDKQLSKWFINLPGVAAAEVGGGLVREIQVLPDQHRLVALGLTLDDVIEALTQTNVESTGGRLYMPENELSTRVLGRWQRVEEIAQVRLSKNGKEVFLGDIAQIIDTHEDERLRVRLNAIPGIKLSIQKQPQANTVAVVDLVLERLTWLREQGILSDDVQIDVVDNQATYVRHALKNTAYSALSGALLAMLVVYLFLGHLRQTLIIGTAIPLAITVTFILMAWGGLTLNIMTLGGLALGVGMVVDNTIVMLENITRHQQDGESPTESAINAVGEITSAIVAATTTNLAAIMPFLFIVGLVGLLFRELIFTIFAAMIASLVVALTVVPALAGKIKRKISPNPPLEKAEMPTIPPLRKGNIAPPQIHSAVETEGQTIFQHANFFALSSTPLPKGEGNALTPTPLPKGEGAVPPSGRRLGGGTKTQFSLFYPIEWVLKRIYVFLMKYLLRWPLIVIALFGVGLWYSLPTFLEGKQIFLPDLDEGQVGVTIKGEPGIALQEMDDVVMQIENLLQQQPEVESVFTQMGGFIFGRSEYEMTHLSRLNVQLARPSPLPPLPKGEGNALTPTPLPKGEGAVPPPSGRGLGGGPLSTQAWIKKMNQAIRELNLIGVKVFMRSRGIRGIRLGSGDEPFSLRIQGADLDKLTQLADDILPRISDIPGLNNLEHSAEDIRQELAIIVDKQRALALGLTVKDIGQHLKILMTGEVVTDFIDGDESIDVRLRLPRHQLQNPEDLQSALIYNQDGLAIHLSEVAQLEWVLVPSEIMRDNQQRIVEMTGTLDPDTSLLDIMAVVEQRLANFEFPEGYTFYEGGATKELQENQVLAKILLGLAVFLVFVVMAVQYESLRNPLVILFSIPFVIIGVAIGIEWLEMPLSMPVWLGMIMLAGIVVNNAIVLVETIELQRKAGHSVQTAILMAGELRLRPILMTTLTTVMGLLPLALSVGEGAKMLQPLATTIVFGLSFSLLVSLLLVPVFYQWLAGLTEKT